MIRVAAISIHMLLWSLFTLTEFLTLDGTVVKWIMFGVFIFICYRISRMFSYKPTHSVLLTLGTLLFYEIVKGLFWIYFSILSV
ncbi:hypothetical protein Q73_04775 [Bacillus coahuilensis m2-6]|uniref:Uncharacterized protein n=1 Tax=Bacillus coahuilensis p1.1.43 TaxID=1150625 RepID=A0A147KAI0_9BACI|nr:hypothetical protein [Bacillus coahuilensis]KUP07651.1 hypothetical protein Q75_05340 [Bacillus coahuilensis p1.1.43]KUP08791.1 hypothetical protein Q73_04775 [Bacillus coahuilensis m2-6]